MDFNQIKELLKIIDSSSFMDFNIDFENTKINLSKNKSAAAESPSASPAQPSGSVNKIAVMEPAEEPMTIIPGKKHVHVEGNIVEAPLVGTFYKSASPDKPPFVSVGSKVKKGDVLCIVEAMKVMNEITSNYEGTVTEILADNEDMVEYGQRLFVIV